MALEQELQAQGYSLEEVQALRRHYKEEYSEVCAKEKVVFRELNTGKAILNSMIPDSISDGRKTEYKRAASKIGCFFTQLGGAYGTKSE